MIDTYIKWIRDAVEKPNVSDLDVGICDCEAGAFRACHLAAREAVLINIGLLIDAIKADANRRPDLP